MNDPHRRTGRTTRQLQALLDGIYRWPRVVYATHTAYHADYCYRLLCKLAGDGFEFNRLSREVSKGGHVIRVLPVREARRRFPEVGAPLIYDHHARWGN